MTPSLPRWLRDTRISGYVNIYELCPEETRVYGTESLYGDWHGQILILAQDFYPSSFIRKQMSEGVARPYSHNPQAPTNTRLQRYVSQVCAGSHPLQCNILYGSALAGLLRDDGSKRGTLSNKAEALAYGRRVLDFTIANMPRLKAIVCLGGPAWACVAPSLGAPRDRREFIDSGTPFRTGKLAIFAGHHPVASIAKNRQLQAWLGLEKELAHARAA